MVKISTGLLRDKNFLRLSGVALLLFLSVWTSMLLKVSSKSQIQADAVKKEQRCGCGSGCGCSSIKDQNTVCPCGPSCSCGKGP